MATEGKADKSQWRLPQLQVIEADPKGMGGHQQHHRTRRKEARRWVHQTEARSQQIQHRIQSALHREDPQQSQVPSVQPRSSDPIRQGPSGIFHPETYRHTIRGPQQSQQDH